MKFGYGAINCQRYPDDKRSDAELYAEALMLAEEAERLGFADVWTTEHHFFNDSYSPSLLPLCAAIAARTTEIRIGTAVLLAPLYDPIRLAEDAATVDLLSGGRLILGLGLGWRPEEFEALRVPLRERARRLEDTVAILRQAWSGQLVTGGSLLSYPGVLVRPLPAQPGGPPIWIGAFTEKAVRRAGRIADGFMPNSSINEDLKGLAVSPAHEHSLGRMVSWAHEELAHRSISSADFPISIFTPLFAWRGDDAWERVRDYYYYAYWKYEDMAESRQLVGPPARPPALTRETERKHRREIIVGTPRQVADRLLRLQEEVGVELHIIARLYWPGMKFEVQREAMRIFSEEVIPRTR